MPGNPMPCIAGDSSVQGFQLDAVVITGIAEGFFPGYRAGLVPLNRS